MTAYGRVDSRVPVPLALSDRLFGAVPYATVWQTELGSTGLNVEVCPS